MIRLLLSLFLITALLACSGKSASSKFRPVPSAVVSASFEWGTPYEIQFKSFLVETEPPAYSPCTNRYTKHFEMGIINSTALTYFFLDYSCEFNFGLSTHGEAVICPQNLFCNACWPIQRPFLPGDTLYKSIHISSPVKEKTSVYWTLYRIKEMETDRETNHISRRDAIIIFDSIKVESPVFSF